MYLSNLVILGQTVLDIPLPDFVTDDKRGRRSTPVITHRSNYAILAFCLKMHQINRFTCLPVGKFIRHISILCHIIYGLFLFLSPLANISPWDNAEGSRSWFWSHLLLWGVWRNRSDTTRLINYFWSLVSWLCKYNGLYQYPQVCLLQCVLLYLWLSKTVMIFVVIIFTNNWYNFGYKCSKTPRHEESSHVMNASDRPTVLKS